LTIAEFIASRPDLSTLNSALALTELDEFFDTRPGPFTYFAPDNDAWEAVQGNIVDVLFNNSEFRPQFTVLLGYHGLNGLFLQDRLVDGLVLNNTLVGESVTITSPPTAVNDLRITEFNNVASNGVVHIISSGILAPSWVFNSLAQRVASASSLSTFNSLLGLTDIDLSTPGAFTLLGATNDAFERQSEQRLAFLRNPANQAQLVSALAYNFLPNILVTPDLREAGSRDYVTFEGSSISVTIAPNEAIRFNNASIVFPDVLANNGVLQLVSEFLLPPSYIGP
jgi:uncharacterized surface protein with fasciclin (FAS1) repeats